MILGLCSVDSFLLGLLGHLSLDPIAWTNRNFSPTHLNTNWAWHDLSFRRDKNEMVIFSPCVCGLNRIGSLGSPLLLLLPAPKDYCVLHLIDQPECSFTFKIGLVTLTSFTFWIDQSERWKKYFREVHEAIIGVQEATIINPLVNLNPPS